MSTDVADAPLQADERQLGLSQVTDEPYRDRNCANAPLTGRPALQSLIAVGSERIMHTLSLLRKRMMPLP